MRKRSKYRPRYNPLACMNAVIWSKPLDPHEAMPLKLTMRSNYEALRSGKGDSQSLQYTLVALQSAYVMAIGIDASLAESLEPGIEAMCRVAERVARGKGYGIDADGLRDMPVALDVYEAIIDAASPKQLNDATREAYRRAFGHRLNYQPGMVRV